MQARWKMASAAAVAAALCGCGAPPAANTGGAAAGPAADEDRLACEALRDLPNLTITTAKLVAAAGDTPSYCYVRGAIPPGIAYHVQLPLPSKWNGRFLKYGDGTKDGDLDYADHRLAQGYAVANSNMGHDAGAEPGAWFAFDNRQAEIDFGYRAVHLTANAGKSVVAAYYERPAAHSYFEGCSTGGREGLIEAQRFPSDFDGIVAGAPVFRYQELNAGHTWLLQRVFRNDYAGNLAFDADGDGKPESLRKLELLADAVLARCDANDGIEDGVLDEPLDVRFRAEARSRARMSARTTSMPTPASRRRSYRRSRISIAVRTTAAARRSSKAARSAPSAAGRNTSARRQSDVSRASLQLARSRRVPVLRERPRRAGAARQRLEYVPDKTATPPEWAWWEFDIDDLTAGKADLMKSLMNATDPDLERFLLRRDGKLILWHGWNDAGAPPAPTQDYYDEVVATTFDGDGAAARERARLFMFPGMGHCGGGPGPNTWDPLAPLVEWVENGTAPDSVVAHHSTDGRVDNERRVCAYPQVARYSGRPAARTILRIGSKRTSAAASSRGQRQAHGAAGGGAARHGLGPLHVAHAGLERRHADLLAAADRVDEFFLDAMECLLLARVRQLRELLIAASSAEDLLLVVDVDRAFAAEDPDLIAAR